MSGKRLSGSKRPSHLRTWIEIDAHAASKNLNTFRRIVGKKPKIWAVVKSNAYGHGLVAFARIMELGGADALCVDSLVEGLTLRREGITLPILVIGPTLVDLLPKAHENNIAVSISNFESLTALVRHEAPPEFHVKLDTGMHRQGFFVSDIPKVVRTIASAKPRVAQAFTGVMTHFATAKDPVYPSYTEQQFQTFEQGMEMFRKAGYKNLVRHASATGGTLMDKKYHLDAVRVGIGLYGMWPSRELQTAREGGVELAPVLSWRTMVAEVKELKPRDFVGYDLTERLLRKTTAAILPVGYWHGFPRALSSVGEVLIRGRRAKVLGRVSMDLLIVDATDTGVRVGDTATLIGRDQKSELHAAEVAREAGTTAYELLTRLNPLIERVVV